MFIVLYIRTKIRNVVTILNFNLLILSLKVGILPSKKGNMKWINENKTGTISGNEPESCALCGKGWDGSLLK
jgi:hypothetical protein